MYIFTLMDTYVGSWSLMVSGLTELVAVTYVYGEIKFDNLYFNID